MTYTISIAKDGEIIIERDASADMVIALLAQMTTNNPPEAVPETKQPKRHKRDKIRKDGKPWRPQSKASKALGDEINEFHARRQHPETARIEQLLIEGKTTPEIMEKVKVSPPTVGVIRARLKKEGKL
jgi:hypothetical protein